MNSPIRAPLPLLGLSIAWVLTSLGQEPPSPAGDWKDPPADGAAFQHEATQMRFPSQIGSYDLVGVLHYHDSPDRLLRYESLPERSRGDIFVFTDATQPSTPEAQQKTLNDALTQVFTQLADMTHAGQYEDVSQVDSRSGEIPLWKSESAPMIAREMAATKIDQDGDQTLKTPLRIWYGLTLVDDHLITLRHYRPADAGEPGLDDLKRFIDAVIEIIKDPPLRRDILPAFATYLDDPLSEAGHESANLILQYLENSPTVSVLQPAPPITTWTQETEKVITGSGSQLLRAYVIGGAHAAFQGRDINSTLTAAGQHMIRVYLKMKQKYPLLAHPGLEALTQAVERGESAAWLRQQIEKNAEKATN